MEMPLWIGAVFLVVSLVRGTVVRAQSVSVSLKVLTGEADLRLGGDVELRCSFIGSAGLGGDTVLEWRAANRTLVWNGAAYDNRYLAGPLVPDPSTGVMSQRLSIARLRSSDLGSYRCNLRLSQDGGGSRVVGSDTASLTVPEGVFPEGSPVCSPDGARSVPAGRAVVLSCTTAPGQPVVTQTVREGSRDVTALFTASSREDRLIRRREVTLDRTDDGLTLVCTITSPLIFPGLRRSCTMGPLIVSEEGGHPGATSGAATDKVPLGTPTAPGAAVPVADSPSLTVVVLACTFGVIMLLFLLLFLALSRSLGWLDARRRAKSPESLETSAAERASPEFNPYTEYGDNAEIFTTQEGQTGMAFVVAEDSSSSSTNGYTIPLYSMVCSSQERSEDGQSTTGQDGLSSDGETAWCAADGSLDEPVAGPSNPSRGVEQETAGTSSPPPVLVSATGWTAWTDDLPEATPPGSPAPFSPSAPAKSPPEPPPSPRNATRQPDVLPRSSVPDYPPPPPPIHGPPPPPPPPPSPPGYEPGGRRPPRTRSHKPDAQLSRV